MRLLLVLFVVCLALTGCGRQEADIAQEPEGNVYAQQTVPDQAPSPSDDTQSRLEALAMSIPQVKDAKCVVLGRTAIVGLTLDPALDRSRVNVIKYSVAEAFRDDPAGIDAFVTADMGISERIRHVRDDIANGRPFSGFAQELGDIISRIAPQIPRDIAPPNTKRDEIPDENNFQSNQL